MIYRWKLDGLYPMPAQTAGEELDRIYNKRGKMDARDVVDEARPETAVLHPCFEWRDPVAAELWREQQARNLIGCVVTVAETSGKEPVEVRAYIQASDSYRPTNVVVSHPDMRAEMERNAMRDMEAFKKRYAVLTSLVPVFDAMEKVEAGWRDEK